MLASVHRIAREKGSGFGMETRETIRNFRERGILVDVRGHQLDPDKTGLVLVTCGDCDRTPENILFIRKVVDHSRLHELKLNGASLRIAKESPLNGEFPTDRILLEDIAESCMLKGIRVIALCGQYPCGKGASAGLGFKENLDLAVRGKMRIKAEVPLLMQEMMRRQGTLVPDLPVIKVAMFMHVDYEDRASTMRTYFVSRERWEAHHASTDGTATVFSPSLPPPEPTDNHDDTDIAV